MQTALAMMTQVASRFAARTSGKRVFIAAGLCLGLWFGLRLTCPDLLAPYSFSRHVYDRDGRLLRLTRAEDGNFRIWTPLQNISPELVSATLLYEDRWFPWHPGVNPAALWNAASSTYLHRERRRGGSTLTMQLARMRYSLDTKNLWGKAVQIARALQLEARYSKREILEAYLNLAPYGGNIEGAAAASRIYFRKDVSALTPAEASALAVIPQHPAARAPRADTEPVALLSARTRLANLGPETLSQQRKAPVELHSSRELPFLAPHAVERALSKNHDRALVLTLDQTLQRLLERKVTAYVERHGSIGIHNAAAMLVDVSSAEVLAQVGSANFYDDGIFGQVDGTHAKRSPGSALKPLVYARALDEGLIHPRTVLNDVPSRFGSYNPENFDRQYVGPLNATDALTQSRNVPAVELNLRLQRDLYSVLDQAQIAGLKPRDWYGAGIVLGAAEVSMEELVELYLALARGGQWTQLRRLRDDAPLPSQSLFSMEAAELTLSMLSSAELPAGIPHTSSRANIAWKTGTSYAFRDAWTAGVFGNYVLAVWVGNFDGSSNPSFVGRSAAAPLFFEISEGVRELHPVEATVRESKAHFAEVEVCSVSGGQPHAFCPLRVKAKVIPGVSPIQNCDVHRLVPVEISSGKRVCRETSATRNEVFEFWPSDVSALFSKVGLARKLPPPFLAPCDEPNLVSLKAPRILTPQPNITYQLRKGDEAAEHVPLLAHADGSVSMLTWFAGAELIGRSKPGQVVQWSAPTGRHELRAVDDQGGTTSVVVNVQWHN